MRYRRAGCAGRNPRRLSRFGRAYRELKRRDQRGFRPAQPALLECCEVCLCAAMSTRTSRAVVQTAPRQLELREVPVPGIDDDSGLLRVEACGICGSDAEQYAGVIPVRMPLIPGHEPLGRLERIGDRAAKRWGVNVGARAAPGALN